MRKSRSLWRGWVLYRRTNWWCRSWLLIQVTPHILLLRKRASLSALPLMPPSLIHSVWEYGDTNNTNAGNAHGWRGSSFSWRCGFQTESRGGRLQASGSRKRQRTAHRLLYRQSTVIGNLKYHNTLPPPPSSLLLILISLAFSILTRGKQIKRGYKTRFGGA